MIEIEGYRIQPAEYDVADLLTDGQESHAWNGNEDLARSGVSICGTLEELAAYLADAGSAIPYGAGQWVVIHLVGEKSSDLPVDAAAGEMLVHPTEILSVEPMGDEIFDMISEALSAD